MSRTLTLTLTLTRTLALTRQAQQQAVRAAARDKQAAADAAGIHDGVDRLGFSTAWREDHVQGGKSSSARLDSAGALDYSSREPTPRRPQPPVQPRAPPVK